MTNLRLSQIPEDSALVEKGLELGLGMVGLAEPFVGALKLSYELRRIHGKILGHFSCQGRMRLECSRCLGPFEASAEAKFLLEFEKKPEGANPRSGADPADPELNVVFFEGDSIDFADEIRQEMELQIPFAPLCKPGCLGLCPSCGADLNQGPCGCGPQPKDSPFQGLKTMFQQNKEN